MADEKISVELVTEGEKLKGGLDKGQAEVRKFGDNAKNTFKQIGTALVAAFAVQKIVSFVKTGITEFAKFERSMDQITAKVERAGQSFDGLSEQVEGYIRAAESATRFSKFQLAASLDNLIGKTGDYNTALALNEKAMDLAVFGNVDLKVAADALALAYEGNTSGMSQLARIMGMSTEDAKDLDAVFAELDSRTAGVARSEEGLAVKLDQLSNSLNDAAEVVGESFGPELVDIGMFVIKAFTGTVSVLSKTLRTLGATAAEIGARLLSFANLIRDLWSGPKTAWAAFQAEQVQINKDAAAEIEKIWIKGADKKKDIDLKALREGFRLKRREVAVTEEAEKDKNDIIADAVAVNISYQQQLLEFMSGTNAAEIALFQMSIDNIKNLGATMAQETAQIFEAFTANIMANNATVLDAFKELGRGMFKIMVNTFGEMLIAEGAKYYARAIAAVLSVVGAGAAPGLFAAGASITAAGGVIKGLVAKLAEGGLVTEPTTALIGEAGPELVIPLDRLRGLGAGVDLRNSEITMAFPGVRSVNDLQGQKFAETAERQLAAALGRMNQRAGRYWNS